MATQIPSYSHPITDPKTGLISSPWYQFLAALLGGSIPSGGAAPADAVYVVGTANADLTNERVATDSPSIDFDLGTAGQLKAHVIVDAAGALDGGTSADLKVRVDNATIEINGSNELAVIGGTECSPLTNGDEASPELVYSLGDVIMVCV